jgi:hypothetical protein
MSIETDLLQALKILHFILPETYPKEFTPTVSTQASLPYDINCYFDINKKEWKIADKNASKKETRDRLIEMLKNEETDIICIREEINENSEYISIIRKDSFKRLLIKDVRKAFTLLYINIYSMLPNSEVYPIDSEIKEYSNSLFNHVVEENYSNISLDSQLINRVFSILLPKEEDFLDRCKKEFESIQPKQNKVKTSLHLTLVKG